MALIREHLDALCASDAEIRELVEFSAASHQHFVALEGERNAHADELRLINQDINHLEDTLKGVRTAHTAKQIAFLRKYNFLRGAGEIIGLAQKFT